jgi:hypothetical protein
MPIVINATQEPISIKIAGNYFTWKPGQERVIREASIAKNIEVDKKESGLAVLPDLMTDDEEVSPEEFEARKVAQIELKQQLCEAALDRYVTHLRSIIANNQVSLRRDLEQKNIKADPAAFASKGEIDAMRLVAKYQKRSEDAEQAKIDEVKKIMANVNGK